MAITQTETDKESKVADKVDTDEDNLRCGYFSWRPDCLRKVNKPPWLLVTVMFMAFTQGMQWLSELTRL